jgi:hypothetical protein
MPQFALTTDVYQGFNFNKQKQVPFGYISSLKIGNTTLDADLPGLDPISARSFAAVGVVTHLLWELGVQDAISFSMQVSVRNSQSLKILMYSAIADLSTSVSFVTFSYDPVAKQFYKSFYSSAVLSCTLAKSGTDLALSIADDPSQEVRSPLNFTTQITLAPKKVAPQTIGIATSAKNAISKPWGL